jgi:catalase
VGDGFKITPEEVVDGVNERYGRHPGYRALHAKGFFYKATFTATPEAAGLTRAAHIQGDPVPAMVRLSNGSGRPDSKDYVPDVRGMAVSFELPDGSRTDVLAQTAPNFPINTPEGFVEVVQANVAGLARLVKFPVFLARHPSALPGLPGNLKALAPPRSYATRRYFPIHTFKWVGADGGETFVKYTWVPEAGEESISAKQAKEAGPNYLREEMQKRLERGPVRFQLQLKIGEDGDETDDPRANWPDDRETLTAGTLEITEPDPLPEQGGEIVVFDPMRLTDGIEPSGDRILQYRPRAYSVSAERRS